MTMNPDTERQLAQFEQLRAQYQTVATQLFQYKQMMKEIERAMEEMEQLPESSKVYKEIGSLMIEVEDRGTLKDELSDKLETMGIRAGTLENQEGQLKKQLTSMKADIENALSKE